MPQSLCSLHRIPGWVLCLSESVKDKDSERASSCPRVTQHPRTQLGCLQQATSCLEGHTAVTGCWGSWCRQEGTTHQLQAPWAPRVQGGCPAQKVLPQPCVTAARVILGREGEGG